MQEGGGPAWSVIIPTRDRPDSLRATVDAVARLLAPEGGAEIVVVDDGGSADLGFVGTRPGVRLVRQAATGPAAARNTGARAARGRWLAFTDDDCRPAADWLARLADGLAREPQALAGGRTINALDGNPFSAASQSLNSFLYAWPGGDDRGSHFLASNNLALSRRGFEDAGGFDPSFRLAAGEDRAFCNAWRRAGRRLIYLPEARVLHHHRLNLGGFWQQHVRYGRGAFLLRQRAAATPDDRLGLNARIAFTAALLAHPFRTSQRPRHPLLQSALLLGSQGATACGYALEWVESVRARRG